MSAPTHQSASHSHKRPFSALDQAQATIDQSVHSQVTINQSINQQNAVSQSVDRNSAKFIEWKTKLSASLIAKVSDTSPSTDSQSCSQSADNDEFEKLLSSAIDALLARVPFDELRCVSFPSVVELMQSREPFYSDVAEWAQPVKFHNQRIREMRESYFIRTNRSNQPTNQLVLPAMLNPRPFALVGRLVYNRDRFNCLHFVDSTGRLRAHVTNGNPLHYRHWMVVYRWNLVLTHSSQPPRKHVLELDFRDATLLSCPSVSQSIDPSMAMQFHPSPIHLMSQSEVKALFTASSSSSSRSAFHSSGKKARSLSSKSVHLLGKLISKSPLIAAGPRAFLGVELQLSVDSQDANVSPPSHVKTVFILFQEVLARLFAHLLNIGHTYLFTHLKLVSLPLSSDHAVWVFTARPDPDNDAGQRSLYLSKGDVTQVFDSEYFSMPQFDHYASSVSQASPVSSSNRSPPAVSSVTGELDVENTAVPVFSCLITRQIVPGVFELDHNSLPDTIRKAENHDADPLRRPSMLWLYLTHAYHPSLDDGVGLRPGARIRVTAAHRIYLQRRFMGFRCCSYTSVEILTFSQFVLVSTAWKRDSSDPSNSGIGYKRWYDSLTGDDTALFVDLIQQLSAKVGSMSLAEKIGLDQPSGVIRRLSGDCFDSSAVIQSDPRAEFFEHQRVCCFARLSVSNKSVVIPPMSYLFLCSAMATAYQRIRALLAGSSGTTVECLVERIASRDCIEHVGVSMIGFLRSLISVNCHVPSVNQPTRHKVKGGGYVCSTRTGFAFTDGVQSFDGVSCEICGDCTDIQLDALYLISHFTLVLEAMSPTSTGQEIDISATLVVDASNLIKLYAPDTSAKVSAFLSRSACAMRLVVCDKLIGAPAHALATQAKSDHTYTLVGSSYNDMPSTKLTVKLNDQCALWWPLIKIGSTVTLSSCVSHTSGSYQATADCTLKLTNHSRTPPAKETMSNHQSVDQLLQFDLCGNAPRDMVCSFAGVVESKEWRFGSLAGEFVRSSVVQPTSQSISPAQNLKWHLKVRDALTNQSIDVYINQHQSFPAAIIPGSYVSFHRCRRIVNSAWRISVTCDRDSVVQLESISASLGRLVDQIGQSRPVIDMSTIPSRFTLMDFWHQLPIVRQLTFKVTCRVVRLLKASFSMDQSMRPSNSQPVANLSVKCATTHSSKDVKLSVICIIDDGTAIAILHAQSDLAWRLLSLSRQQRRLIDGFTRKYGAWTFDAQSRWESQVLDPSVDGEYESEDDDFRSFIPRVDAGTYQHAVLCVMLRAAIRGRQVDACLQQTWQPADIEGFEKVLESRRASASTRQSTDPSVHRVSTVTRIVPRPVNCGDTTINSLRYAGDAHFKLIEFDEVDARAQAWRLLEAM